MSTIPSATPIGPNSLPYNAPPFNATFTTDKQKQEEMKTLTKEALQQPAPASVTSQRMSKALVYSINTAIGMGSTFGILYGIGWTINKVQLLSHKIGLAENTPGPVSSQFAVHQAIALPFRPFIEQPLKSVLGSTPKTKWLNLGITLATSLVANTLSAAICNKIGYEMSIESTIKHNIYGVGINVGIVALMTGIQSLQEYVDRYEDPIKSNEMDLLDPRKILEKPEVT